MFWRLAVMLVILRYPEKRTRRVMLNVAWREEGAKKVTKASHWQLLRESLMHRR